MYYNFIKVFLNINNFNVYYIYLFIIVVQVQLSPFLPPPLPPPHPSLPTTLNPNPLWLCPCVLYTCSLMTLPPFSPLSPPIYLRSVYCQFVLYFNVSGYVLLTYLFCWLSSTYRWDHMVFVFYCLAYFN